METYGGIELREFDDRLTNVRKSMESRSLDSLLVFSEPNRLDSSTHGYIRYLTNWSGIVPSLLVVPMEGSQVLMTSQSYERKRAREATWLQDVRAVGDFAKEAAEILRDRGAKKVGLIGMDAASVELNKELHCKTAGVEFEDASHILDELRMIKSPAEIDLIKKACKLSRIMFESLMDSVRKSESVKFALARMEFEGLKEGAEISDSYTTGPNADYPRWNPPMNLRFDDGYQVTAGSYANYNGYWCQEIRMGAKGKPSKSREEVHKILLEAQDAAFSLMRPGVLVSDVVERILNVLKKAGHEAVIRVGHGMGLEYSERYISDCFLHPMVAKHIPKIGIEKNMVFQIHPSAWSRSEEFSVVGDMCLVTDGKPELLTTFSRELFTC